MTNGVLGLGTGAGSLNNELIEKLKTAERASTVAPIETSIENIKGEGGESEKIQEIKAKVEELLNSVKPLDLFVNSGVTVFEQKTATANGSAVIFDATDVGKLNLGTTSVSVTSLAQRDVFQSGRFFDKDAMILGSNGASDTLVINHNGEDFTFETNGKTYEELAQEINNNTNFVSSIETVNTNEFRLVIKSKEPGLDNALTITQNGSLDLGFDNKVYSSSNSYVSTDLPGAGNLELDGETFALTASESYQDLADKINASGNFNAKYENNRLQVSRVDGSDIVINNDDFNLGLVGEQGGKTLAAKNMEATVDGVAYSVSSNSIVVEGGLKITATELGNASINVQKDDSNLEIVMKDFINKYNELSDLVDNEIFSAESKVEDKATLRAMMTGIKEKIFASYGPNDDLNIFNAGFEINKSGTISLDSTKFNEFAKSNPEDMKMLFLGVAEDKGLGTQIKEYVDDINSFSGILTSYENNITSRKEALEKEKDKAIETLDNKYSMLAQQFASYNTIINRFEAQFSGLKLMIGQSIAGK